MCQGGAAGPVCSQTESPVSTPPPPGSSCSCPAILPWLSTSVSELSEVSGWWHDWTSLDKVGMLWLPVVHNDPRPATLPTLDWTEVNVSLRSHDRQSIALNFLVNNSSVCWEYNWLDNSTFNTFLALYQSLPCALWYLVSTRMLSFQSLETRQHQ